MRRWVRDQTGIELGYIEQLYTYGDRDRLPGRGRRVLSIAYLGLVGEEPVAYVGEPSRPNAVYKIDAADWASSGARA